MLKNLIILPDGTQIASGAPGAAILELKLTQAVNSREALTLGSVCAAMLEATILAPEGLGAAAGEEVSLLRLDGDAAVPVGRFILEEPVKRSASVWSVTAYDRVSLLDRDLTDWLAGLQDWPYTLQALAQMVCQRCGVRLADAPLPNGSYRVQRFAADGITGRQLMQWIGEAAGRFCRARPDGTLEFAWYTPAQVRIGPEAIGPMTVTHTPDGPAVSGYPVQVTGAVQLESKALRITDDGLGNAVLEAMGLVQLPCYQGSLQPADYATEPVKKVQIRLTADDVGAVYPDTEETENVYSITGNYLLTAGSREALAPIAQGLYEQLRQVSYTPCRARIPAGADIRPGQILQAVDHTGRAFTLYVMTRIQSGGGDTLECTGTRRMDSPAAVNNRSFQALSGRVLELRTDVEGLKIENRDAQGKTASLSLDVDGLTAQVLAQGEQMTSLLQTAEGLQLRVADVTGAVEAIQTGGVSSVRTETGYTFDAEGLRILKTGQEMESLLSNTGMYVRRSGDVILQADNAGVVAVDVTARNYLIMGEHARFEDYSDGLDHRRTACYWIGGASQ